MHDNADFNISLLGSKHSPQVEAACPELLSDIVRSCLMLDKFVNLTCQSATLEVVGDVASGLQWFIRGVERPWEKLAAAAPGERQNDLKTTVGETVGNLS